MLNLQSAIRKDKENEEKGKVSYVYFIRKKTSSGKVGVKIGTSIRVMERLLEHANDSDKYVILYGVIYGGYVKENELHQKYKDYIIDKKGEIYNLNKNQIEDIKMQCNNNLIDYKKLITYFTSSKIFRWKFDYNREGKYIIKFFQNKKDPIKNMNKYLKRLSYLSNGVFYDL